MEFCEGLSNFFRKSGKPRVGPTQEASYFYLGDPLLGLRLQSGPDEADLSIPEANEDDHRKPQEMKKAVMREARKYKP